jgi:hypothetical protein
MLHHMSGSSGDVARLRRILNGRSRARSKA